MSNFALSPIKVEGIIFQSVEHAYQWLKTKDPSFKDAILASIRPGDAKRIGGEVNERPELQTPGFFEKRIDIMRALLKAKFAPGSVMAGLLIKTYPRELVEGNWWGDVYWGVFNGHGENNLGKLLMEIREELMKSSVAG